MKRPELTAMDLSRALETIQTGPPAVIITMSEGQWDGLLQAAYDTGAILLELDRKERPVRAYQRMRAS